MTIIFSDIGGVVLTNGWDSQARHRAILFFELDADEVNHRHDLYFPLLELGKLSLDDYIEAVIFYKKRPFTKNEFLEFIYNQSQVLPDIRDVFLSIKKKYGVKIYALSNESGELAHYRYRKFHLGAIFDAYLVSAYIKLRKPDPEFYRLALNLAQKSPEEVIYIDDRPILVEAGQKLGLRGIVHVNPAATWGYLEQALSDAKNGS